MGQRFVTYFTLLSTIISLKTLLKMFVTSNELTQLIYIIVIE